MPPEGTRPKGAATEVAEEAAEWFKLYLFPSIYIQCFQKPEEEFFRMVTYKTISFSLSRSKKRPSETRFVVSLVLKENANNEVST